MAKQYFQNVNSPRDGKTVYIGSDWKTVTSKQFNKEFTLRTGYEITERTIDKYGQFNLVPDVEVETWWTNLGDPDEEIIRLYHAHGECEQFHSEVKLTWIWAASIRKVCDQCTDTRIGDDRI